MILIVMAGGARASVPDTLVFAGDDHYPPFQWRSADGHVHGFVEDLEQALAEQGGRKAEHRLMDWPQALADLQSGKVDVVAMFASRERGQRFLFTTPFYFVTHGIYGHNGHAGVAGPEELAGHRVALEEGGYAAEALKEHHIQVQPVYREDYAAAMDAVLGGYAEYALLPQTVTNRRIMKKKLPLQPLGPPLWPRAYVFAVSSNNPQLHDWLQTQLGLVVSSGRYYDIYQQWRPQIEWASASFWQRYRWLLWTLAALALLMLLGYGYSWQLRRVVRNRTGQLQAALSRQRKAEKEVRYWLNHDRLTGLPTRGEFVKQVRRYLGKRGRAGHTYVVMVIHLSDINDIVCSLSYETGEAMVAAVARRLQQQRFKALGYFGRGVFGVLAEADASRQHSLLDESALELEGVELEPHFGVGLARYPQHSRDVIELLRQAEIALATGAHRQRYWAEYRPSMDPDPNNLFILRDFRRSGSDGLSVCVQPQVDLASGAIVGGEVLVRWQHPSLGALSPAYFVPLLEQAGLVGQLTEYVLDQAVQLAVQLRDEGRPTRMSVNVSAVDILESDLFHIVMSVLEKHGGLAEDLRLEMTETCVIGDPQRASEVVSRLSARGVACSIDDFGVGFSSMSHLRQFAVSEVKIDRSFVHDMCREESHYAIVKAVVALAHELSLTVVAEGPEDMETVQALQALCCDRAQGYVFSRPLSVEDFRAQRGKGFLHRDGRERA
ncbi:MAG: EAL domain-containing protein [Alcanivorax sp.]|nr:EAL domain-containing protein [Alcanivorax sp.]